MRPLSAWFGLRTTLLSGSPMLPSLLQWLLVASVTGSIVGWVMYLSQFTHQPLQTLAEPAVAVEPQHAAQLFGSAPTDRLTVNIKVLGVVASQRESAQIGNARGASGSAILSLDGKPPQVFYPGDEVAEGATLQTIRPEKIILQRGAAQFDFPVPQLEAAQDFIRPVDPGHGQR